MTARNAIVALLAVLALPAAAADPALEDLAWMAGAWRGEQNGVVMEEVWTMPAGGMMLGLHRDVMPQKTSFEFLRIAKTREGIVYFASPGGQPPTPFRLAESGPTRVVFANPAHDFPKRILYWRDGDRLCARVEAEPGGEGEQWCWSKAK